ncbi:ribosome hibernation-promoting factor, HPF/YfiA family [Gemmatimonadota bacterium]
MRVQITARHCELPDAIRERTEDQIGKLSRYQPRLAAAEVVFETEKHLKKVEAILSIDRREPVVASGAGPEFQGALDQMVDRLSKILRRRRGQKKDHHGPRIVETAEPEE